MIIINILLSLMIVFVYGVFTIGDSYISVFIGGFCGACLYDYIKGRFF
jgi:hypothetical protein